MGKFKTNRIVQAAALGLAVLLAPAAHAAERRNANYEPARNTGVGQMIAQQGNEALRAIRAEFTAAFRAMKPQLPAANSPRVVKMSQPAGAGAPSAAGAALAE